MYLIVGLIVFMNVIKDLSWKREPRKIKKMPPMKCFQKWIRWKKLRVMVRSSLPMNRLEYNRAEIENKFKHNLQDTLNPLYSCGNDVESTKHFLLHCPQFAHSPECFR